MGKAKPIIKEIAWKIPISVMWDASMGFPIANMSFLNGMLAMFCVLVCLDLIRWGLEKD